MRHHGSDSGSLAGHGTFGGTYDIVHYRYGGNENLLDLRSIPNAPVVDGTVLSYPASWLATILLQAVCFYFVRKKVHSTMPQEEPL